MNPRPGPLMWIVTILTLLVTVCSCSAGTGRPETPSTSGSFSDIAGPGLIGNVVVFGPPQPSNAPEYLEHPDGVTVVLAYNLLDSPKQEVHDYLDAAQAKGFKVIVDSGYFIDETALGDVGPGVDQITPEQFETAQAIKRQYGATPDEQLAGMVREFQGHPAVWGFLGANNLGATGQEKRFQQVTQRIAAMKFVTDKPFLVGGEVALFDDNNKWVREQIGFMHRMRNAGVEQLMFNCVQKLCEPAALQKLAAALQSAGYTDGWMYGRGFSRGVSDDVEFATTARAQGFSNIMIG